MKNYFKYKIIPLVIIIFVFLSGCGRDVNVSEANVNNTASPSETVQNQQQVTTVSRYGEIFDPTKDTGKLVVRFLYSKTGTDTKSGDSTIIKTPDGKVMLIDGSAPETAHTIKKYLDALGIKKIDAIVASHPHIDHIGGLAQIVYQYNVERVYRSNLEYDTSSNNNFLKAVNDKKVETVILKDGMSFNFGDIKVDVYNPVEEIKYPKGYPNSSTAFINDNSVVLKMTYKESSLLFPGDLYIGGEASLLERHQKDIQADILKMPHHGDETSSSSTFIKAVQPKIAIAMGDQLYSLSVYNSYRKNNSKAFITAVDGCVKVMANGTKEYEVVTEKDRESDLLK